MPSSPDRLRRRVRPLAALLAAALAFCLLPDARAGITFTQKSVTTTDNVGAYTKTGTMTAIGQLLGSGETALMVTTDAALFVPAGGAARVEAVSTLFSMVTIVPDGIYD